jgi:hypothetical protein
MRALRAGMSEESFWSKSPRAVMTLTREEEPEKDVRHHNRR